MKTTPRLQLVKIQLQSNVPDIQRVRQLSNAEERSHLASVALLRGHDDGAQLLAMVGLDVEDFHGAVEAWSAKIPTPGQRSQLSRDASLDLNRRFLALLASMRQFLDHHETRLKRSYADSPEVYDKFAEATKTAFDRSFDYRFAYKLRNYAQHCGVPLGHVDFETRLSGPSVVHQLHLLFDRDLLLTGGKEVWGPVKADLEKQPEQFPVDPLPRRLKNHLDAIWNCVVEAEEQFLQRAADTIGRIALDARGQGGIPAIVRVEGAQIHFVMPPVGLLHTYGHMEFRDLL